MRVEARDVERFLGNPGACRVVLLHGDDAGLLRERADRLVRAVAGTLDDPFRVAVLGREGHDRLIEEATAQSMLGGRRVVRVRDAADALTASLQRVLGMPGDSLVVLEAASMPSRSKLRVLLDGDRAGAAIACYPEEGRALAASVSAMVQAASCRIEPDALAYLVEALGADRGAARQEIEKLVLYAGGGDPAAGRPGGVIDIDAVEACVADASALSLEDALFAATAGDVGTADRALERAIADGAAPVAIARALLTHFARLRTARRAVDSGIDATAAAKAMRPPVFFKRLPAFTRALGAWSPDQLGRACAEVHRVELACKQTGAPDLALCRHLLAQVARQASRAVGFAPGRKPL